MAGMRLHFSLFSQILEPEQIQQHQKTCPEYSDLQR